MDPTMIGWKRKTVNGAECISDFMMSRGFSKDFTSKLTAKNYDDIEMFIASMVSSGESPLEVGRDNMDNLANQVKGLEDRIKELEGKYD